MLEVPVWKRWLVSLTILFFVVCAIPSFLSEGTRAALPKWLPAPTINLGLDLAGGSYILLEASVNEVAANRVETMREAVVLAMRRDQPRIQIGEISARDGRLSFLVRDVRQVDAARERLLPLTVGDGVTAQREWNIEVRDTTRFVLTPTQSGLDAAIDRAMNDATEVVRRRIDELGTREPTIVRQGTNRIVVQVPGLQDPAALKALLGKTARLEFRLVDLGADPQALLQGNAPVGSVIAPYPTAPQGLPYVTYRQDGPPLIALQRSAIVTGDQLIDARQEFDETQQPSVGFTFDGAGGRRFAKVTQENVQKPFAIQVDGQVISAPVIQTPILGGRGQITGGFTVESANELAIALRSGKLPVALTVVEERTIGPDLGADSIRLGIIACIVGGLLVMLYMAATYGWFGMLANFALILNVVMIVGAMALINGTLTLPGLAGFVLTIGAAVDANVIINERIREELRRGRRVMDAIDTGWREASTAIIDANVTNLIAGVLMFAFGSGPIRGFAVVLVIGIATSAFTAITVARMIVALWARRTRPKELYL